MRLLLLASRFGGQFIVQNGWHSIYCRWFGGKVALSVEAEAPTRMKLKRSEFLFVVSSLHAQRGERCPRFGLLLLYSQDIVLLVFWRCLSFIRCFVIVVVDVFVIWCACECSVSVIAWCVFMFACMVSKQTKNETIIWNVPNDWFR